MRATPVLLAMLVALAPGPTARAKPPTVEGCSAAKRLAAGKRGAGRLAMPAVASPAR